MVLRNAIVIASVLLLLSDAGRAQQSITGVPRDQKLTAEQRAVALLRQMTVEEKAMQLSSVCPVGLFGPDGPIQSQLDAQIKHGIGHVAALGLIGHKTPEQIAKSVNAVQRYLVTQTRLKIPAIFHNEAMSGVVAPHFTQFPTSIGLAATWDPEATQEIADIIRRQMRAVGLLQALSPVLDVARDARWGRASETYGEDPYLVSALGVAYTRGLQGQDLTSGVLATAKHFVGYAVTEGGQNMAATAVGPRELYDVHARPFEAAFRLAGLASVMPSYSEFDGVPISASRAILTDMLRGRMGFTGTTVSDYVAVNFLHTRQKVAGTAEEAGLLALAAGMDIETPAIYGYGQVLAKAVRDKRIPESVLDRSVRRVLRDKFALGLFENPYVSENPAEISKVAAEGVDLSKRLAAASVTLLKNDKGLLPLSRDVTKFREFPLVLGHEGVGEVVAIGEGVTERQVGDRVGLPMMQKSCGRCDFCREQHVSSFVTAANCASLTLTGINVDGAHAEYILGHASGTVLLPKEISYEYAAPTLCGGYTVWAAIRRAAPKPGAHIAVVGIGGLGHFAIQYAKAAGFGVTAVTRTSSKAELARQLGADNVVSDGAGLKAAGGADVIMHTSSSHAAVVNAKEGLRPWGKVIMNGSALDEMTLPALPLVSHSFQIVGSAHNSPEYLAEALELVASGAVKPMIEAFPKERVADAYERAASGAVRFKAVVTY